MRLMKNKTIFQRIIERARRRRPERMSWREVRLLARDAGRTWTRSRLTL